MHFIGPGSTRVLPVSGRQSDLVLALKEIVTLGTCMGRYLGQLHVVSLVAHRIRIETSFSGVEEILNYPVCLGIRINLVDVSARVPPVFYCIGSCCVVKRLVHLLGVAQTDASPRRRRLRRKIILGISNAFSVAANDDLVVGLPLRLSKLADYGNSRKVRFVLCHLPLARPVESMLLGYVHLEVLLCCSEHGVWEWQAVAALVWTNLSPKHFPVVGGCHSRLERSIFPNDVIVVGRLLLAGIKGKACLPHLLHFESAVDGWIVTVSPARGWEVGGAHLEVNGRRGSVLSVGTRLISALRVDFGGLGKAVAVDVLVGFGHEFDHPAGVDYALVANGLGDESALGSGFAEALLGLGNGLVDLLLLVDLLVHNVARAIGRFSLFESHLLEHVVLARLPFLLLHEQVVGRSHLVVLVVLHVSRCLVQLFPAEVRLQVLQLLGDHRDAVLAHNDSIHFDAARLAVPIVRSDVLNCVPL